MTNPQPANTVRVTFDDGTVVNMSLREGFRFMGSLAREGWEIVEMTRDDFRKRVDRWQDH